MKSQSEEDWSEVESIGVADAVVERILLLIREGRLKPGDRLPTENELITVLGVGRSSIREAKRALAAMRLIESTPGRGSFVREIDPGSILSPDVAHLLLADETSVALQEARELLEPSVAALVAEKARAPDLAGIKASLEEMKRAVTEGKSTYDAGMAFHFAIVQASCNPVIINLYQPIMQLLIKYQRPLYERYADRQEEIRQHSQIYAAIEQRNARRARDAMGDHLKYVRRVTATMRREAREGIAGPASETGHVNNRGERSGGMEMR